MEVDAGVGQTPQVEGAQPPLFQSVRTMRIMRILRLMRILRILRIMRILRLNIMRHEMKGCGVGTEREGFVPGYAGRRVG